MRAVIETVSGNRSLVRLLTAYLVNVLVEYGQWIALLVYAYHRGGASEAGLVAIAQLLPSIALGPVLIAHGKRFGIVRLLLISFAVEAVSLACCGVATSRAHRRRWFTPARSGSCSGPRLAARSTTC